MRKVLDTNTMNFRILDGYVKKIDFYIEKKEPHPDRAVLRLVVEGVNTNSDGKVFLSPFTVMLYKERAKSVQKWIKAEDFVHIQGQQRLLPNGAECLQAVYIESKEGNLKVVEFEE